MTPTNSQSVVTSYFVTWEVLKTNSHQRLSGRSIAGLFLPSPPSKQVQLAAAQEERALPHHLYRQRPVRWWPKQQRPRTQRARISAKPNFSLLNFLTK